MNITPTFTKKILYRLIDLKISMVADKGIECTKAICAKLLLSLQPQV
jgi:hypothetical protein